MQHRILTIDDDSNIRALVREALQQEGFEAVTCETAEAGLAALRESDFDLIVLDILLPDIDGRELFRQIRNEVSTPIIFLSRKAEEIDRIVGLELGADDYVTKPFSPRELVARVKAVLRRARETENSNHSSDGPDTPVVEHGDLKILPEKRQVKYDGEPVDLTKKQFDLLTVLARRPDKVFSRRELIQKAYDTIVSEKTIDSHMRRVRKSLANANNGDDLIETVRGVGFTLSEFD